MEAVLKIPTTEFNNEAFFKIRSLASSFGVSEITISLASDRSHTFSEAPAPTKRIGALNKFTIESNDGKGVTFTMDEFEEYIKKTGC